jgi:FlaA1/EpsC-like NDP-sugar epimerase/ActR/RegA family two-component response regulator
MNIFRRGWQENLVFVSDAAVIVFSYVAAYFIRFDGMPQTQYMEMMIRVLPFVLIVRLAALFYFKLNTGMWQYASMKDLTQIIKVVTVSSVFIVAIAMVIQVGHPRSIFIIDWLLLIIALSGTRFTIRLTRSIRSRQKNGNGRRKKVLVVGAGDAGEAILREMIYHYSHNYEVVGLIDDDPKKHRKQIHGVPVLGAGPDIPAIVSQRCVEEIIIAIPSATSDQKRGIVDCCIKSGAKYRTVPNMSDLVDGTIKVKALREVRIEDLLKRDEVITDKRRIEEYIKGKRVLITGAGGSIGSELCRQVARLSPAKLILLERSENALFYIDMELRNFFKEIDRVPIVGDIGDRKRLREVFTEHNPQIIFHAAAYKHVPMMEINSAEAIKNNVFGTKVLAEKAIKFGVEKFIMLSTDKAVEPTSLMGASKRIAELYLKSLGGNGQTKFMAVRFGNVLGSEGSVVPIFKRQIEKGGPITITHPDIKRYFMTIPEAAGLVLEAGSLGEGGEIFILEMGRQIKIADLANDMVRLSGLQPNKDIEIVFTGLRPGEKMHEALVAADEKLIRTNHEKIMIVESNKCKKEDVAQWMEDLEKVLELQDMNSLINTLKEIVPAYEPSPQLLKKLSVPQGQKSSGTEIDILIADDEKIVQDLLRKFLEGRGYNTFLASNGREALDIVAESKVQIAIIDIRMPGLMNGIQTLKHMKMINKDIEVIIITGFGTKKIRRQSNEFGAYAYLEKPFELVDIKRYVEGALKAHSFQFSSPCVG